MSNEVDSGAIKNKIRQLYEFLKEVNLLRFRPVRTLDEQPKVVHLSDLPDHPSMQLTRPVRVDGSQEIPGVLLRVKRPTLTRCPEPPPIIYPWLLPNWDDPWKSVEIAQSQNEIDDQRQTKTIRFSDDSERAAVLDVWLDQREAWATPERSARKAMAFFEAFYDIHSQLEKDGEQLELVAADGHLVWQAESAVDGVVHVEHPVLLKRVDLRFNPTIPEFTVHDTERETELYGALFVDLQGVAPAAISNRNKELESGGYHPFGWEDTEAFLKAFIQTVSPVAGEYFTKRPSGDIAATPRMYRDMVLVLRKRIAGISNAVDAILTDIDRQVLFPPALAQVTGTTDNWEKQGITGTDATSTPDRTTHDAQKRVSDDEILLAHEANQEQMQIIRRLTYSGSVVVQGPPGTGKTHTIGNLIGHLLAHGKSVLVTAQTAKALRVLRDKIPELLRPLAVSVLGSDQDARRQLESAIASITERLTQETAEELQARAQRLRTERKRTLTEIKALNHTLTEALENEYREIVVGDTHFAPSDAARFVSKRRLTDSWIPSPLKEDADIPLTPQELIRLYALGGLGESFTPEEELDARQRLPDISLLPTQKQFEVMATEHRSLSTTDFSFGSDRWSHRSNSSEALATLAEDLSREFTSELILQSWRPYAIVAGIHGGTDRHVWENLVACIRSAVDANTQHALLLHHRTRLATGITHQRHRQIAAQIIDHLDSGGTLKFLQLATRSEWRLLIKGTSVAAGRPNEREHFEALRRHADAELRRSELEMPWNELIGRHIQQPFSSFGETPEMSCRAIIPEIERCLDWNKRVWLPLVERLKEEGIDWEHVSGSIPREPSPVAEYNAIQQLATKILPPLLLAEIGRRRRRECEDGFRHLGNLVNAIDPSSSSKGCVARLLISVRSHDVNAYADSLSYTARMHAIKPLVAERDELVRRLRLAAPSWGAQLTSRVPPHDKGTLPGDVPLAWTWRQLNDALERRDRLNAHELQGQIERKRALLRELTEQLIDASAWGTQLKRLQSNNSVRQALVGWLDTMKRLASVRAAERRQTLVSEGRKLMRKCADAVPVWIMPIPIVAESFEPTAGRFDVVIIDEASQGDLNALIPLYLGKQVVVVGDHEQVTPLGVGKAQTMLDNLRKAMLRDIPNSHLFDNLTSIYDIGRQSFGDAIRLVEHFRCVPEIISFSNQLSYEGKIRPLRESNSTQIKPACVPKRVNGFRDGDKNEAEAEFIVDRIRAMISHPAYAGKTIGVISMLGEAQALLVQSMIHRQIPSTEIESRRIQAGISGEFQGDERDVVFLSMVDSAEEEGQLRTTGEGAFEQTKKRYNVAASRARDQLWVVHSFDPDLHLKSGDLRLKLLNHVRDPLAWMRARANETAKTESPFERDVLQRLTDAGFRVTSQWHVGYYRIDMVIQGSGKRLALECDGDRYHPMEKLAQDMERQSVLERLGWQFLRIRGSAFYRDPDSAMRVVFDRLANLGIAPEINDRPAAASDSGLLVHELDDLARVYEVDRARSREAPDQKSPNTSTFFFTEGVAPLRRRFLKS